MPDKAVKWGPSPDKTANGRTLGRAEMVINRPLAWNAGFAVALLIAAGIVALDTMRLRVPFSYDSIGPTFLPYFVAIGLGCCGSAWLVNILMRRRPDASDVVAIDRSPILIISLGLIIQFTLIDTLGWIVVAGIQFALVSRAFQSARYLRDLLVGLAMGAVIFVAFNFGLGLNLPAGTLFRSLGL
jgi:putative tricarboxylic transport membrane protein